jgi:glycosyltransferase involved in cell wall biosynthesis
MKKILFIVTQSELGGAQKFLCELLPRLDRNKYEILAAAGKDGDGELFKVLKEANIPTHFLNFLRRKINPYSDFRAYLEIRDLIKNFKPDVVFLNSSKAGALGSLATSLPAAKASKFPRLKVIYRIGGWSFNDPGSWLARCFYILAEKYTARFKDIIIVNNRRDLEQAKKLKIRPRQSIELIYNGIDPYKLNFLEKDEAKIRLYELLPQKQGSFLREGLTIGTIANFYPTKGLQYLVEAFKILAHNPKLITCNLVIIGDGPERENLQSLIANYQLQNKIFLAGRLPEAYKYLPAFDIFVLPSVKEGFPWALLEAMVAKLPVVATNVGAAPEIIEDEKNGFLVEPRQPELLAQKIEELIADERRRKEFGIQAHQTVVLKFDLNKMIQQVENLL